MLLLGGCSTTRDGVNYDKNNFYAYLNQCKADYKAAQFDGAIADCKAALAINPTSDEAHFLLGYVYFSLYMQSHEVSQLNYAYDIFVKGNKATDENTTSDELEQVYKSYGRRDDYSALE